MEKTDLEKIIHSRLQERGKKALNKNALNALFSCLSSHPLESLSKLFLLRKDVVENEKHKVQQDIILDLLCDIDNAIQKAFNKGINTDNQTKICGEIITIGENTKDVTGVHIKQGSGLTKINPGTQIKTKGRNVGNVTGIKIGG